MGPQELPVAQLIQPRDADTVFIRSDMFGDDVQRSFAEVEVGTDPRGGGNSSGVKYIFDHPLCEFPRGQAGSLKIGRDVHEHLVDGIGVDIFRRHISQVDAVDLSGDPFVFCHPRYCDNIVDLCMAADLVLPDLLLCLEEPWPSWDALCLQRGGDRQTDRLVGSGLVRYQQVCLKRIESPMNTFYGCVI